MRLIQIEGSGPYQPVSETFRAYIDQCASTREMIDIVYEDDGSERLVSGVRISGLTGSENEFIQIVNGGAEMLLRLDTLRSVNDVNSK